MEKVKLLGDGNVLETGDRHVHAVGELPWEVLTETKIIVRDGKYYMFGYVGFGYFNFIEVPEPTIVTSF